MHTVQTKYAEAIPAPRFDCFMNKCWLITVGTRTAGHAR